MNCEFKGDCSCNVYLPTRIETTTRSKIEPTIAASGNPNPSSPCFFLSKISTLVSEHSCGIFGLWDDRVKIDLRDFFFFKTNLGSSTPSTYGVYLFLGSSSPSTKRVYLFQCLALQELAAPLGALSPLPRPAAPLGVLSPPSALGRCSLCRKRPFGGTVAFW